MKNIKKGCLLVFVLTYTVIAHAQSEWNWGEEPEKAESQYKLCVDLIKQGKYEEALASLNWLLKNTPDLHVSIYQNGVKVYKRLAKGEKDLVKKDQFQKKVLSLYDSRVRYFNDEARVLTRKANDAYLFYSKEESKYQYLFNLYTKAFELNGVKMPSVSLIAYMNVTKKYQATENILSDKEIINIYTKISNTLSAQKENASVARKPRYDGMLDQAWKMLERTIDIDCDLIQELLVPKLKSGTNNLMVAKRIFSTSLSAKCTNRLYYIEAGEIVFSANPDHRIALSLGYKCRDFAFYDKAHKYFDKVIELSDDHKDKAKALVGHGSIYYSTGKYLEAREMANKAMALHPQAAGPYSLLGNLYYSSYKQCKKGESEVVDRAVYIAAYDMYKKAADLSNVYEKPGNLKKAIKALKKFPLISDINGENYREGQTLHVECWINTDVRILRRPDDN